MKTLISIVMLLLLFACVQYKKEEPVQYSFEEIGQETAETVQMIEDIKAFHESLLQTKSTGRVQDNLYNRFFASMDDYNYYKLPTYKLDIQKLYANPDVGQIKNCIVPADFVNVIAVKDGKADIRLKCKKIGDRWVEIGGTCEYGDVIGWIRDSLANANTKEYKILIVGDMEFVTYNKGGKDLYFNVRGRSFLPEELCEFVVNCCNNFWEE